MEKPSETLDIISIIIPNYNGEKFILETLNSVLAQTCNNWECILIDDGSTDNSIELIQDFISQDDRFSFYLREKLPKGANACRNIGIHKARGKYVMFLDNDDLLEVNCIENRLKHMDTDLDLLIHGTKDLIADGQFRERPIRHDENSDFLSAFLTFKLPWQICSPTWNIKYLKKIGGFDETFQRLQDPELHIRALENKEVKIRYLPQFVDTIYRNDASRKKYMNESFYTKSAISHLQISESNIARFKNKPEKKALKKGLYHLLANLSRDSKKLNIKNEYGKELYQLMEFHELLNESQKKWLKLFFYSTDRLPSLLVSKSRFLTKVYGYSIRKILFLIGKV